MEYDSSSICSPSDELSLRLVQNKLGPDGLWKKPPWEFKSLDNDRLEAYPMSVALGDWQRKLSVDTPYDVQMKNGGRCPPSTTILASADRWKATNATPDSFCGTRVSVGAHRRCGGIHPHHFDFLALSGFMDVPHRGLRLLDNRHAFVSGNRVCVGKEKRSGCKSRHAGSLWVLKLGFAVGAGLRWGGHDTFSSAYLSIRPV